MFFTCLLLLSELGDLLASLLHLQLCLTDAESQQDVHAAGAAAALRLPACVHHAPQRGSEHETPLSAVPAHRTRTAAQRRGTALNTLQIQLHTDLLRAEAQLTKRCAKSVMKTFFLKVLGTFTRLKKNAFWLLFVFLL